MTSIPAAAFALPDPPAPAYPSAAVPLAHPARMRAWASMHGVGVWSDVPFRYLEIGCGNAQNLLALAARFPQAELLGVDRDAGLVEQGRRDAEACGLGNLRLVVADVRAYAPASGEPPFDYVVAHGVYSWIPPDAQERLLAVTREALAPLGVAYLSYNTFPGWGIRGVIREVMRDAAGGASGVPGLRAAKGRLGELKRRMVRTSHPYSQLLAAEIDLALDKADGYLIGEHLAEANDPVHVKELLRRASLRGLSYVCELLPATPEGDVDGPLVAELCASGMSRADAEQCLDVLAYRQFRATLLCRAEVPVAPAPAFEPLVEGGFFSAPLTPAAEEPLLGPGKSLVFRTHDGVAIETTRPLLKAALLALCEVWPGALQGPQLVSAAVTLLRERGLLAAARIDDAEIRSTMSDLVQLCRRRLIEVLPWAPAIRADIPSRPVVRPLTRLEASRSPIVTSPGHDPLLLEEPLRTVVRLLDGTRDLRALVTELSNRIDAGELALAIEGGGPRRAARLAEILAATVSRIRKLGLLDAGYDGRRPLPGDAPAPRLPVGPP